MARLIIPVKKLPYRAKFADGVEDGPMVRFEAEPDPKKLLRAAILADNPAATITEHTMSPGLPERLQKIERDAVRESRPVVFPEQLVSAANIPVLVVECSPIIKLSSAALQQHAPGLTLSLATLAGYRYGCYLIEFDNDHLLVSDVPTDPADGDRCQFEKWWYGGDPTLHAYWLRKMSRRTGLGPATGPAVDYGDAQTQNVVTAIDYELSQIRRRLL